MLLTFGKLHSRNAWLGRAIVAGLFGVFAAGVFSDASAQTSMEKRQAMRANSPFNLNSGPTAVLQGNLIQCGIDNQGNVCTDIFNSPTGGGGFWPSGTTNQYIFNSGLQIAGINGGDAGPWANDTVGAYFFDARGTQPHGTPITDVFNALDPNDLGNWPTEAFANDTSIFNQALVGSRTISDQDSWVTYWDGDPNRISQRSHPAGIRVEQRSLAFNAPAGAENTIFFIYKFTNITNDPAFQQANEAKFNVDLPAGGWTIGNLYAAFAMDPDVTTHAGDNFSTAILPFNMGVAYHARFQTDDFNFAERASLYAPPFFQGPGFVGVKYLRSPIDATTGREVGLTMFSNTTNGGTFPDPTGVKQLFRYLKGDVNTAAGDPSCTITDSINRRLCALVQDAADTRFYQASGPFQLGAGESSTIVVAYTHGAPVTVAGYTPGTALPPGIPSTVPGVGGEPIRTVEQMAGLIQVPTSAVGTDTEGNTFIDESQLVVGRDVVPRSLLANALVAQSIFNNKFLLPRPPEAPVFTLVPGTNQVTVIWQPSATDQNGDPYYSIASDTESPLFNPNYREHDVEGYRIYRATGLGGGFELIAQFDKTGTVYRDVTGELDPTFVPEEGSPYTTPQDHELNGDIVQFFEGGRIRNQVTGSVFASQADTLHLNDTGVPYAFVDRSVRNGITYRYIVTAFDVNSLKSGASSLESPRTPQFAVPRSNPTNLVLASFSSSLRGDDGTELDPDADPPTIDPATGVFSGPQPPANSLESTFAPLVERLLPAFTLTARVDSIVGKTEARGGCPNGSNWQGMCWSMFVTYDRDGTAEQSVAHGWTPVWGSPSSSGESSTTTFSLGGMPVPPEATGAEQFDLPAGFPGFLASVEGTFNRQFQLPGTEGQYNRRIGACNTSPTASGCTTRMHGGSRWFSGDTETLADPTTFTRVGQLTGVDTIIGLNATNHTPRGPGGSVSGASTGLQCLAYGSGVYQRAADVQFTWGGTGAVTSVRDVSNQVAVPFQTTGRASFGFLTTDANGNGFIDWDDFMYLDTNMRFAEASGFCGAAGGGTVETYDAAALVSLSQTAALVPVSTGTDPVAGLAATGVGFGIYVNGEHYIVQATELPGSGTVWTLRTYAGEVRTAASTSLDASGYTYTAGIRPPVPGLQVVFESTQPTATVGDADLDKVHTVPDPYYVRSAFDLGPSTKGLRFVNLPAQAIVRIYTLNGTLVRVLGHNDPLGGGELQWDLRNRNNQFVATGVYFYVVEASNGDTKTGRFTVVQFAR